MLYPKLRGIIEACGETGANRDFLIQYTLFDLRGDEIYMNNLFEGRYRGNLIYDCNLKYSETTNVYINLLNPSESFHLRKNYNCKGESNYNCICACDLYDDFEPKNFSGHCSLKLPFYCWNISGAGDAVKKCTMSQYPNIPKIIQSNLENKNLITIRRVGNTQIKQYTYRGKTYNIPDLVKGTVMTYDSTEYGDCSKRPYVVVYTKQKKTSPNMGFTNEATISYIISHDDDKCEIKLIFSGRGPCRVEGWHFEKNDLGFFSIDRISYSEGIIKG